jgi:hypothetical protein
MANPVLVFYAYKAGSVGKGMFRSTTSFFKDKMDLRFYEKFSIMYYPNSITLPDPEDNRKVLIHPGEYLLFYEHYQKNAEEKSKQTKQTKFLRMANLEFEELDNSGIRIINKRAGIKKVYIDIYPEMTDGKYLIDKTENQGEDQKNVTNKTILKNILKEATRRSQAAIAKANIMKFCTKNEKYNCNAVMTQLKDFTIEKLGTNFAPSLGGKRKRRRTMRKRRRHSTTRRHKKRRRRTHKKHRRRHTKGR